MAEVAGFDFLVAVHCVDFVVDVHVVVVAGVDFVAAVVTDDGISDDHGVRADDVLVATVVPVVNHVVVADDVLRSWLEIAHVLVGTLGFTKSFNANKAPTSG